jgi:hypothetical protein
MPRPTLFDHPKFHRLVYILKIPEPQVLGLLEYMWRVGYASGNPVIGDAIDVEIAAKWWGEPGLFAGAGGAATGTVTGSETPPGLPSSNPAKPKLPGSTDRSGRGGEESVTMPLLNPANFHLSVSNCLG